MLSISPVKGMSILPCLHLLPLFLTLVYGIQGATLREHRLREPGSYELGFQLRPPPSAEMVRALRYIQSLSEGTLPEAPAGDEQPVDKDIKPHDMETVRSMLRLAAPARGSTATERDLEEREDDNDKAQQWLQAVLTTLQETEEQMVPQKMSWKVTGHTSSPPRPRYPIQPRPKQQLEVETSSDENYERSSLGNPSNQRRHRQYPLIFEEDQEQPLKRTNENAEEQYTPQKLATLQSVFEELSGISTAKTNSKRESVVASREDDDDDDLYRQRKMALEDILGTDEWEPSEEQKEMEVEQRERHKFDDDQVKRSNQPDFFTTEKEESENIAKLVNLLKLLESKEQKHEDVNDVEQEEQETYREVEKKDANQEDEEEQEEERDEEEREIKSVRKTFPQTISQLITISQKLQIPPADVLDLLQNNARNFRIPAQSQTPTRTYTPHKTYATAPHQRPLQTLQRNRVAQDIMSILELVSAAQQNNKPPQRPSQTKPLRYYEKERDLPKYGSPETSRDDYDDTTGEEDELASFLASEMLMPRRAHLMPSLEQRSVYGTLEHAVQDYLDKNAAEKRSVERKSTATSLDNETMMRILRYLEPESKEETESESKTIPEM
ncbi:secretogranin-2a [Triplophysa dalaica]|uniref:secretogranin-2a n=1 Tax=Triplophysa dalaica TaxID=1582913 RepID=UPI0024E01416|nr:secretogranin-2a [Triplophysa dalaica]